MATNLMTIRQYIRWKIICAQYKRRGLRNLKAAKNAGLIKDKK